MCVRAHVCGRGAGVLKAREKSGMIPRLRGSWCSHSSNEVRSRFGDQLVLNAVYKVCFKDLQVEMSCQ